MARKKFSKSKKRGSVLALVLFAIILLFFSGMGVLPIGQTVRFFSVRTAAQVSACSAADTGITKAIYDMNKRLFDGTWNPNQNFLYEFHKTLSNSSGSTYSYFVLKANWIYSSGMPTGDDDLIDFVNSNAGEKGDYIVFSYGRYTTAQDRIRAIVRLKGCGDMGFVVRDQLILKSDSYVSGADSTNGPDEDPTVLVEIGTTSIAPDSITLNNNTVVKGNVAVGVGGDTDTVIKDLGGTTGLRYAMTEEIEFPYVYPPTADATFGYYDTVLQLSAKDPPDPNEPNVMYITEDMNGRYERIYLSQSQTIIIPPDNDVVLHLTSTGPGTKKNSIYMGQGCEFIIENGATLELWVDGNISMGNSNGFNNLGKPPDLKIYGNWRGLNVGQKWEIKAKSEYFGQVYAPAADITLKAKGKFFGAITGYSFTMMNSGELYYDGALREVDPGDQGVRFVLKRWYE